MSKRLSLTLEDEDLRRVDSFWTRETPERIALEALVDATSLASEAAVLRALIRVGTEAVQARLLDQAYAELAAESTAPERAEHQAIRVSQRRARASRDARD